MQSEMSDYAGLIRPTGARLWALVTPVDDTLVDLVLVSQLREIRKPRRFISGLGFVPMKLRQRLMKHILLSQQKRKVLQDVAIWERKRYRPTPPAVPRRWPHRAIPSILPAVLSGTGG